VRAIAVRSARDHGALEHRGVLGTVTPMIVIADAREVTHGKKEPCVAMMSLPRMAGWWRRKLATLSAQQVTELSDTVGCLSTWRSPLPVGLLDHEVLERYRHPRTGASSTRACSWKTRAWSSKTRSSAYRRRRWATRAGARSSTRLPEMRKFMSRICVFPHFRKPSGG